MSSGWQGFDFCECKEGQVGFARQLSDEHRRMIGDRVKRVQLVQLGIGTVGGEVIEQVIRHRATWRQYFGVDIAVSAVIGREGALVAAEPSGFCDSELQDIVAGRRAGTSLSQGRNSLSDPKIAIERVAERGTTIVMDAAAGD